MGISKDQLINATELIKAYTDDELNDSETRLRTLIQSLYNVIVNDEDNVVNALDETHGLQDTPIGVVLPFMGITVPKHYLLCDGAEYNISDYPILANHFLTDFNKVNHFGGDGVTTFKVPDLRGEFLRGSRTADRNTGTGLAVGLHQDGTLFPNIWGYITNDRKSKTITVEYVDEITPARASKADATIPNSKYIDIVTSTKEFSNRIGNSAGPYTARPTNTAVNYIIKAEPTYFIKCDPRKFIYSEDEIKVGTYIDGSPIYQRVFSDIIVNRPDNAYGNTLVELPKDLEINKVIDLNIIMIQSTDGTIINNSFCFDDHNNSAYSCATSINLRGDGSSCLVFTFGRGTSDPNNVWAYGWFPLKATVYLTYTKDS